jgi:FixJ family two-component response regulator
MAINRERGEDWGSLASIHQKCDVVRGGCAVGPTSATVVVIDDDESVRKALRRLIRSAGMAVTTHASAEEFLAAGDPAADCVIVDVRLPGMSGLDLQRLLAETGRDVAVVVMTAHDDQVVRRTALGAGAVDFIAKPFDRDRLLGAVARAVARVG